MAGAGPVVLLLVRREGGGAVAGRGRGERARGDALGGVGGVAQQGGVQPPVWNHPASPGVPLTAYAACALRSAALPAAGGGGQPVRVHLGGGGGKGVGVEVRVGWRVGSEGGVEGEEESERGRVGRWGGKRRGLQRHLLSTALDSRSWVFLCEPGPVPPIVQPSHAM